MSSYDGFRPGFHKIMDLPKSMYGVFLSTEDAIKEVAEDLKFEGNRSLIRRQRNGRNFYAICGRDGIAHVMIQVFEDKVYFCRGMYARRPSNYMAQVVTFIVQKNWDIARDMANTGILRQNGKYYNVYDLPKGFVFHGDMDLSGAGLRILPDMTGVTIRGYYNISYNDITKYYGIPKEIFGDFIAIGNKYSVVTEKPPRGVKIHGKFVNRKSR